MVDIYYFGYHLLPEGKLLITEIKNSWNNFRLSTHYLNNKKNLSINYNFEDKFKTLFSLSSPYEIKNGIRFMRGTNNLVSEGLKIIAIDILNNKSIFSSISECSIAINIDISKIKHCLQMKYKNFKFLIATPPGSTKIKKIKLLRFSKFKFKHILLKINRK